MLVPGVWKNHLEEVGKGVKLNHWSVWIWFKVIPTRVTSFIWIRSFAVLRSWRIPPKGLLLFLLQYFNTIHSNFLKHPSSPLSIHQHDFAGKNKCIYRLKPLLLFLNVWDLLISREQLCKCGYSLPIKAIYIYENTLQCCWFQLCTYPLVARATGSFCTYGSLWSDIPVMKPSEASLCGFWMFLVAYTRPA